MNVRSPLDDSTVEAIGSAVRAAETGLIELRRDIHAHPETAWNEKRTTGVVASRLAKLGVEARLLDGGSGLVAEVVGGAGPVVALRADLDALPLSDEKDVPYRSVNSGVAHACVHDVHTAALVGAAEALCLLARSGRLLGTVRLLFQPAEEVIPGGALKMIELGLLDGVSSVFAVHCDPRLDVGRAALRVGPITAAADSVRVRVTGPGGHTARPHLTSDLVGALADVVSRTPTLLSRRMDPRAGVSLVWGSIRAGAAGNAIPNQGDASATVRAFDHDAWTTLRSLVPELVHQIAAPYDAKVEVDYAVGVPPAVNDASCTGIARWAAESVLGPASVDEAPRSMGGEDFAWMLERVPGSLVRIGVRPEGTTRATDLHQGSFDVDESAIANGAMLLATTAAAALGAQAGEGR